MMDFMGSGELSVSVASSLARMPLRMCRGVWLMGAQIYAWFGSWCGIGEVSMGGAAGWDGKGCWVWA